MRLSLLSLTVLALVACKPEEDDTAVDDTADTSDTSDTSDSSDTTSDEPFGEVIATQTVGELTVELRAEGALQTGWNEVVYRVLDADGAPVDDLTLAHAPLMQMGSGDPHACPYTQPEARGAGQYGAEVVYQMPSGAMDSWTHTVTVAGEEAVFDALNVVDSGLVKMVMVGDARWVVSLHFAEAPTMRENPLTLTVHRKASMMDFPPVDDLSVGLTPWMTAMDHGSTGNIDPVYAEAGRYEGEAYLSMAGTWELRFALSQGGSVVAEPTFEVSF